LVLFHPDVLGLARHVAEPRIADEEPPRLRALELDGRIRGRGHADELARADAAADHERRRERGQRHAENRSSLHGGPKHTRGIKRLRAWVAEVRALTGGARLAAQSSGRGSQGKRCSPTDSVRTREARRDSMALPVTAEIHVTSR